MKNYILTILLFICTIINLHSETVLNFYSSNNDPERKSVIRYLLNAFELENRDISVNIYEYNENEPIQSITNLDAKIAPDIIMADSRLLHRISDTGALNYELAQELLNKLGNNNFYTGTINSLSSNENLMAVPYSGWLQVLWYRANWFEDAGLERPDTLEKIQHAAKYFTNNKEHKYGIILGTNDEVYTEQCFLQFAQALGFDFIKNGNSWMLKKDQLLDALNFYDSLSHFAPSNGVNWRARDYYFQDRAAMLIYSTHLMDDLAIKEIAQNSLTNEFFEELNGHEYSGYLLRETGMVTSIKGEKITSFGSVSGLALYNTESPDKVQAQKRLVEFLYRSDVYITWLHMSPGGMLPAFRPILRNDNFFRDPSGVFKKYGRDKIISLTEGLENLTLLNTEILAVDHNNGYSENGLQNLVYQWINRDRNIPFNLNMKWVY